MVKGLVYLAGAGPGDAKLLTLRVAELLVKVDIVLYDKLVGKKILSMIPKKTQRLYVGRVAGDDPSNQDTTNEMMVKYAKKGKKVLRLKGGDPAMFGRGGEEAEYLKSHKIKYEIIPGITSGSGSATYSGIPLTHRSLSSYKRWVFFGIIDSIFLPTSLSYKTMSTLTSNSATRKVSSFASPGPAPARYTKPLTILVPLC